MRDSASKRAVPEDIVLRVHHAPTRQQLLVDRLLGVSRRRRRLAYAAIAGGLVALRPMLRRLAASVTVVVVAVAVTRL